jgi:hypothetical protein
MPLQRLVELKDLIDVTSFAEIPMCDDMPEEVRCLTRGRERADAHGQAERRMAVLAYLVRPRSIERG